MTVFGPLSLTHYMYRAPPKLCGYDEKREGREGEHPAMCITTFTVYCQCPPWPKDQTGALRGLKDPFSPSGP